MKPPLPEPIPEPPPYAPSSRRATDCFHGSGGEPLRFVYQTIQYSRRIPVDQVIPDVKQILPNVRDDRDADRDAYIGLQRWLRYANREGLESFALAGIRMLRDVAGSPWRKGPKGDWNGDKISICVETLFDEMHNFPVFDDGIEVVESRPRLSHRRFYEPPRPAKHGNWFTYYAIRWVTRVARRAIEKHERDARQCKQLRSEWDGNAAIVHGRPTAQLAKDGEVYKAQEPWELSYESEIDQEIQKGLKEWIDENTSLCAEAEPRVSTSWLKTWLDRNVTRPVHKRILLLKMTQPQLTHGQIIEKVNDELGTRLTHDAVYHCLSDLENDLRDHMETRRSRLRRMPTSGGKADTEHSASTSVDATEAMVCQPQPQAEYDFDEDGYKICRKGPMGAQRVA